MLNNLGKVVYPESLIDTQRFLHLYETIFLRSDQREAEEERSEMGVS
jgi:hypothetical protein